MDDQGQEMPGTSIQTSPNPTADWGAILSGLTDASGRWIDGVPASDIPPLTALKLLAARLEELVRVTGDVPAPPSRTGRDKTPVAQGTTVHNGTDGLTDPTKGSIECGLQPSDSSTNPPMLVDDIGPDAEAAQQEALAKKFFSKRAAGVPVEEYLLRLHRFCPMSTAVYLAGSRYIHKLAVIERFVPVTPRTVHRLALGGLRVAMKAQEDLSYPHSRFAKVGGVSEEELRKLEIAFCFLTDFDLVVDAEALLQEAKSLVEGKLSGSPSTTAIQIANFVSRNDTN
ncbi:hypothetical protein FQN54_000917 [Arachnomyces sp. PD_36]|nr:hypothetical protein FQN54_000917 [Arachnomyces sp. PD_36]